MNTIRNIVLAAAVAVPLTLSGADNAIVSWNNLGMHCMDSDFSVFSILPPYNTVESQLIVGGRLVTNGAGYTITYEAVADPDGSINSTARGKGNFYDYVLPLYGAAPPVDAGLSQWSMPGTNNAPQPMLFEQTNHPAAGVATLVNWFRAEGIPITPYDDAGRKNPYPLMRLIARNAANQSIATNDVVLPVSDEMDCRACHASGSGVAAQPLAGWVWSSSPERDYRLNILRLHDERQFTNHSALYQAALAARGYNSQGLYRGVVADGKPVLCAACHSSEALGTPSFDTTPPLTASVHGYHAQVLDPDLHITLDSSAHRAACYRCHPGSATKCLRGAMGAAIGADGSMEMQCQSCHGSMSMVGSTNRVGWFMEPNCQSCHTGTATSNNGKIRYTTCFETNGAVRVAVNQTFATSPNTPAQGISLFRFSRGHGGLQCEACHGSTHAEFPSTHRNDNLRNQAIQGHAGVMVECTACHTTSPNTSNGGPHGMHPVGQVWMAQHDNAAQTLGAAWCATCHGADYRGTVLSRAQADRSIATQFGVKTFWRGDIIGCYVCHLGPANESLNPNIAPVVNDIVATTASGQPVSVTLPASDANGDALTLRIIAQPAHGSVGLSNRTATYFPEPGFVGADSFTFAARDGSIDSNLGTGTVTVGPAPCSVTAVAHVPASYPAGWPVPFTVVASCSNTSANVACEWDFGDGTAPSANTATSHTYTAPGVFQWAVVTRVATAATTNTGTVTISSPMHLGATGSAALLSLAWPRTLADAVLEESPALGPSAHWTASTNAVLVEPGLLRVNVLNPGGAWFYRLRQVK